jgi:type IV pilus assembly protein PilV
VLITIVILAIGLLGLAAMQAEGLNNNKSAYQRSQAAMLAYDMADRMRSNMGVINNYLTATMLPKNASKQAVCRVTGVCTTSQMAEDDLYEWNAALTLALPGASGTVTNPSVGMYTVTVSWDEANRDDDRDAAVDADNSSFSVSFLPFNANNLPEVVPEVVPEVSP